MTSYIVLDLEHAVDHVGHRRYQQAERFDPSAQYTDPRDERISPRWPFRRPVIASWLILKPDDDGVITPVRMTTVGSPEHTEKELIAAIFEDLASTENAQLVTWGGVGTDIRQLLLACMDHGITLPKSCRALVEPYTHRAPYHLDLMLAVCGAAARCHLAEVASAFDIPVKPMASPNAVAGLIQRGKWADVKSVCESDVYSTACILARYLSLTDPAHAGFGAAHRIATFAAKMEHRRYAPDFAAYRSRLLVNATAAATRDHEALVA